VDKYPPVHIMVRRRCGQVKTKAKNDGYTTSPTRKLNAKVHFDLTCTICTLGWRGTTVKNGITAVVSERIKAHEC
jgi:hypothetical protein